ncbi:MAG: helix-turn-helix transcriptional regulator [Solirubrobacterales bacterium]|nr:helix-turn-helix transcriptional regulator [Solirubrobacterales bacterium]
MPEPTETQLLALGSTIGRHRAELGLTQEDLAGATGITRNYIGIVERGEAAITVPRLSLIATALGTTAAALLQEAGL